jgi:hypothetical protein
LNVNEGTARSVLNLAAAAIEVTHWDDARGQSTTFDLQHALLSHEGNIGLCPSLGGPVFSVFFVLCLFCRAACARCLAGLAGWCWPERAAELEAAIALRATQESVYNTESVESILASLSTFTSQTLSASEANLDFALGELSSTVAHNNDILSLEAVLRNRASQADLDDLLTRTNAAVAANDIHTRREVDNLLRDRDTAVTSLDFELANRAPADLVAGISNQLKTRARSADVYDRSTIQTRLQPLESTVKAAANKANVPTLQAFQSTQEAIVQASQPATSDNSGACTLALLGKTRLNLANAHVEVCDQGTLVFHWRPIYAPTDCVELNYQGTCTLCTQGMALVSGYCIRPADLMHINLDGFKVGPALAGG